MLTFLKRKIRNRQSSYQSLNIINIYAQNILHNLQFLQSLKTGNTIIPVLKSNAYGHWLKHMCQILSTTSTTQCPIIAVDSYPEYQIVRDYTDKQILILWETLGQNYTLYNPKRTHIAIGSLTTLQSIVKTNKNYNIHLFLNTGMNREWFQTKELKEALQILQKNKKIVISWIISHLANADCVDSSFNHIQIENFKTMYHHIKDFFISSPSRFKPKYIQIGNSAGIVKIDDPFFNTRRAGISLYGYNHFESQDTYHKALESLTPALQITTTVTSLQELNTWDGINYWLKRKHNKKEESLTTATLPFGYNEWLPRTLHQTYFVSPLNQKSNHKTYLPLVWSICMNLSSSLIDKSVKQLKIGDTIEIVSPQKNNKNTIQQLAWASQRIPYEILTGLNSSLKRVII